MSVICKQSSQWNSVIAAQTKAHFIFDWLPVYLFIFLNFFWGEFFFFISVIQIYFILFYFF